MGLGSPKTRWVHDRDFGEYDPDPKCEAREEYGVRNWVGSNLDYIPAGDVVPSSFPKELEEFLKHVWKSGTANKGAPQKNFLGAHRGRVVPEIFPTQYLPRSNPAPAPPVLNAANTQHLSGVAKDWKTMLNLPIVRAYTFRGVDAHGSPEGVRGRGGFHPNAMRDDDFYLNPPTGKVFLAFQDYMQRSHGAVITAKDYTEAISMRSPQFKKLFLDYSVWRALLKGEELHLGRMLANELLKGYISSTKAVKVAKGYAGADGWVYSVLVRGGYHVPEQGKSQWTAIFGEQEIAFPGSIPWNDVYGFRKVNNSKFTGSVWLRAGSGYLTEPNRLKIHMLLSGQPQ